MPEALPTLTKHCEPATQSLSSSYQPQAGPPPLVTRTETSNTTERILGSACRDWTGKQTTVTTIQKSLPLISRATSSNWTTARDGSFSRATSSSPQAGNQKPNCPVVPTDEEVGSHALRAITESS